MEGLVSARSGGGGFGQYRNALPPQLNMGEKISSRKVVHDVELIKHYFLTVFFVSGCFRMYFRPKSSNPFPLPKLIIITK